MKLPTGAAALCGIAILALPAHAEIRRVRASDLAKTVMNSPDEARDSFSFASQNSKAHLEMMRAERSLRRENADLAALGQYQYTALDHTYFGVNAWSIWVRGPHEVQHRVTQDATARPRQRVLVRIENGAPMPVPNREHFTAIDGVVGGSTPWTNAGPRDGDTTYWAVGQAHGDDHWRLDTGVHVKRDVYTHGVLYTLTYADTFSEITASSKVAQFAIIWKDTRDRQLYVNP